MGLRLNEKKTRVRKQGQQQEVTGIVVNYKTQLPKSVRKEIRKNMYYICKYGLESHLSHIGSEQQNYLSISLHLLILRIDKQRITNLPEYMIQIILLF